MTQQNIRRRQDGSIDIGFYRAQGETERRAAMLAFVRSLARLPALILARAKGCQCGPHHIADAAHRLPRLAPDPA